MLEHDELTGAETCCAVNLLVRQSIRMLRHSLSNLALPLFYCLKGQVHLRERSTLVPDRISLVRRLIARSRLCGRKAR